MDDYLEDSDGMGDDDEEDDLDVRTAESTSFKSCF
jgi:hypothetical protein